MPSTSEKRERRTELVRRLMALAPGRRVDAMLEEIDGKALVRSLPAEDVYSTIIDVGLADSTEIVQLSTPEQFRTYVDLAAWQRDRLDPIEVLHWLRAARGEDDDEFITKVRAVDIELLELVYRKLTLIHDLEENPDVDATGVTIETPEGKLLIELALDGPDEAALHRLTRDLMAQSPFELSRFLEAVRWELPSELEETAFQFRQSRLQDLGFPPLDEASRVFSWVDPDKISVLPPATDRLTSRNERVDSVSAMFLGLDADERANLEGEVRYLVNCVLVAEGAEPGDPPAIRRFSEQARDYLDLGLEHLTGGDPQRASEVVRAQSLKDIFRVGFSLTLKAKRQVERLAAEPNTKFGETWLALGEETAAILALLRRRPLKALKVPGAEPVPFRAKRELAEVDALLQRVRTQRAVFTALLGSSPADVIARFGMSLAEVTPQRIFAAVVARAEIDGVVDVSPFPEERVIELCARLFEETGPLPRLRESAGKRSLEVLSASIAQPTEELQVMIDRVLQAMVADFGETWLKDGRVDPKRIEAVPIAGLG